MDADRIAAIRARANAATPGPWLQTADTPWGSKVILSSEGEFYLGVSARTAQPTDGWSAEAREQAVRRGRNKCADAAFIAGAREWVPELLDALEAAQADNAALRGVVERAKGHAGQVDQIVIQDLVAAEADRDRLRAERAELCRVLGDVLSPLDEPCHYDRHGYCQAHFLHDRPCPVEEGIALLARLDTDPQEPK